MPKRLFDFKCSNEHTTEMYVDSEEQTAKCPECGEEAKRRISRATFILDAISGDYPGATMKWAREHERAAKK